MVVGITGRYCSGKSVLASLFVSAGFVLVDVDAVGHHALEAKSEELRQAFGEIIFERSQGGEQSVNRRMLGHIVFGNKRKLALLEEIVHPWMLQNIREIVREKDSDASQHYVIVAALLHKMKLDVLCDVVLLVETHVVIRALRARKRDGLSFLNIARRFASQAHIPRRKTLKRSGKTAEIQVIKGVCSIDEYKEALQQYLSVP